MKSYGRVWHEYKPILRTGFIMLVVVMAIMLFSPPSDFPLDYENNLRSVESSFIEAVGHDFFDQVLVLEFKDNDKIYVYYDVPRSEYKRLVNADSIGGYFNANIKGKYEMRSMEM